MRIATWNVNSIKARLEPVLGWLRAASPDVLLMQELKGVEFPAAAFADLGYETAHIAEKAYNGVAIVAREAPRVILDALPGDETDTQARYLEVDVSGRRVINIYAPNGNPVDSAKFPYKLGWLERLQARLADLRTQGIDFIVGGDFNIIPEPEDCHDLKAWEGDALFLPESRAAFRRLKNIGLYDALRIHDTAPGRYTFWDYQAGAWQRNHGIRIDHVLLTPALADRARSCIIDSAPRDGERPSDHVPVVLEVDI